MIVVVDYNSFILGGTDIVDQRSDSFTTSSKTLKWSVKFFCWMKDVTRVNAQTIYSCNNNLNPRKTNSFTFAWQLGMALVLPYMRRRRGIGGLQKHLTSKMDNLLKFIQRRQQDEHAQEDGDAGVLDAVPPVVDDLAAVVQGNNHAKTATKWLDFCTAPQSSEKRSRCQVCLDHNEGLGYKLSKEKMNKQSAQCQMCETTVCKPHYVQVCINCANTLVRSREYRDMNTVP